MRSAQVRLPPQLGAAERAGRLGTCGGAGAGALGCRGGEGARPAARCGGAVPAARPPGRRGDSLARRKADLGQLAAASVQLGGGAPELHDGLAVLPKVDADAARVPAPHRRREEASAGLATMTAAMSRIYALANQKGGVGKTTTAVNLAACLAEAGERSLVIDLDPQANATSGLGMRANGTSSYDLLDGAPLAELVHPTAFANLDLVPAKPDLAGAVVELSGRSDGERYLAQALASGTDSYDFVFLDCPPSLGPLTVNALAASDRVLVPVQAEYYALEGLDAAPPLGRADPAAAQSEPRHRRTAAHDGRRPHTPRASGRGGSAPALRRPRLPHLRPALCTPCRGSKPRTACDCLRPSLRRSRRLLEGGDGACRARLSLPHNVEASVAASRS